MVDERYARQTILPEIREDGQARLAAARVLVVGVGGLGSVTSTYLVAAGVGTVGLADFDVVSRSNLQRQVLYAEQDAGKPKVACAAARLSAINSGVRIVTHDCLVSQDNAEALIAPYDIVVDGCDNYATRLAVNDACARLRRPYVYGAISAFSGQVAVLCGDGGKTLRDLFGGGMPSGDAASKGVVGMTPGIVGSVQAMQVLQLVCGFGSPLVDRLWVADFLKMDSSTFDL